MGDTLRHPSMSNVSVILQSILSFFGGFEVLTQKNFDIQTQAEFFPCQQVLRSEHAGHRTYQQEYGQNHQNDGDQ